MKVEKSEAFNICAQRDPINTIPIRIIHIQVCFHAYTREY